MNRVSTWARRINESRHGPALLGVASFLETTVVPIPIELILIPYMVANRHRLWLIATITTLGCLLGALVGYVVGLLLFDSLGHWLIQTFGWQSAYDAFQQRFAENGFWAVLTIGVTPIPFQVAMLAAGAAGYSVGLFLLASAIARGLRYFGLAVLVYLFGARALSLWQNHARAVGFGLLAVVLIGVAVMVFWPNN